MSEQVTTPDRDDTVSEPAESHGRIILEYVNVPHDGHTYALTDSGEVLRMFYGSPWREYYHVRESAIPEHVASVRIAAHQRVVTDRWRGPVPDIERPGWIRGEEERAVAETKAAAPPKVTKKPKEKAASPKSNGKAPKMGANAGRLLEKGLDLSATRQKEVRAAAEALAVKRQDSIIRIWDVYEAAGVKLPEKIASAKREYLETGRMPKTGGGAGRGNSRTASSKSKPDPSASTTPSDLPESSPTTSTESDPGPVPKDEPTSDDETL